MAAAVVSESHPLLTTASSNESSCCVKCKRFQPADGKVLPCLHLICLGCLNESKDRSGCVLCSLCGENSSPRVRGSDLSNQLASSQRLLYTSEENVESVSDLSREPSAGKQVLVCEVCEQMQDEDEGYVVREASYECVDCEGERLFCDKHGENHPKGKRFIGHNVKKLEERDARSSASKLQQSMHCVIHQMNDVITYCKTCQHGICTQCLGGGHDGHIFSTISSVAIEKRASLSKSLESLLDMSLQMADSDKEAVSSKTVTPFQPLIAAISVDMDAIREEAKSTSATVATYYDDLIALLNVIRQQQLEAIDALAWKQLEPYENRHHRLQDLDECYATTTQLCQILTGDSKDVTDSVVIELAEHVEKKIRKLSTGLQRETQPMPPRGNIMAECKLATAWEMKSLVRVCVSTDVDIQKCRIAFQERMVTGISNSIRINLFDHNNCPIPPSNTTADVTGTVVSPSGKSDSIAITRGADSERKQIIMSLSVKPDESGQYTVQIRSGEKIRTVTFNAFDAVVLQADPQKCSSVITVSNENRTVRHTGQKNVFGTVTAAVGYTHGRHAWRVKVVSSFQPNCQMSVGVTVLPRIGNYNDAKEYFDKSRYYGWWASGKVHTPTYSSVCGDSCDKLLDGDTITLVLDCDEKSLEIHVHRTKRTSTITGLKCDTPLYPALCLLRPGHEAQFC